MVAVPARVARCANAPAGDDAQPGNCRPAPRRSRFAARYVATVGTSPRTACSTRRIAATMRRAARGWPDVQPLRRRVTRRRPVLDAPRRESRPGGGWRRGAARDRAQCRGKSGLRCPCNQCPVQAGRNATRRVRAAKRCRKAETRSLITTGFFFDSRGFRCAKSTREERALPRAARKKTSFFPRDERCGQLARAVRSAQLCSNRFAATFLRTRRGSHTRPFMAM